MNFFLNLFKKEAKPVKSKFAAAADRYKQFKPELLNRVFSSDMSILQVSVYKKNVNAYTVYLKYLIQVLRFDETLPNAYIAKDVVQIYLRDFFVDEKGFTINPKESITRFCEAAAELLELCDSKEKLPDKTFELERNLRLTAAVVFNLCSLLEELPSP